MAAEAVDGRAAGLCAAGRAVFSAVGLLVDLLPVGLLVGEVAAELAAVLLHASKLIYLSIRKFRSIWRGFVQRTGALSETK